MQDSFGTWSGNAEGAGKKHSLSTSLFWLIKDLLHSGPSFYHQIALEALNAGQDAQQAGDLADAAVNTLKIYGPQILDYDPAKRSNN